MPIKLLKIVMWRAMPHPLVQASVSICRMEGIGSRFFTDASTRIQNYMASHTRRQQPSVTCVIRNVTRVRWARNGPHVCEAEWHRDTDVNYASSIARTSQWQNNHNTNYYPCFLQLFMYLPLYQNKCKGGGGHAVAKLASYGFECYHPSLPKSRLPTKNTSGNKTDYMWQ
jgi:hypothetical protein